MLIRKAKRNTLEHGALEKPKALICLTYLPSILGISYVNETHIWMFFSSTFEGSV